PQGFRPAEPVLRLTLQRARTLESKAQVPIRGAIQCIRIERFAAVVVRAGGHDNIPVLLDGKAVGRTGPGGIAHVLAQVRSNTTLRVALDTSAFPSLKPKNPSTPFPIRDRDEILILDQPFHEDVKPKKKAPIAHGPEKIPGKATLPSGVDGKET